MKKVLPIIIILLVLLGIFAMLYLSGVKSTVDDKKEPATSNVQSVQQNNSPKIISTKPDPLEEAIISATEVVEISFNRPLENVGEFKVRIDPKIDYKVELSGDRKTAKIIPSKPYELGSTYTLFIGTETKFDGVGRWGEEKIFHFRTVRYRGI